MLRRNPRVADQYHHAPRWNGKLARHRGGERGANTLTHLVPADTEAHAAVIRNLETRDGRHNEAGIRAGGNAPADQGPVTGAHGLRRHGALAPAEARGKNAARSPARPNPRLRSRLRFWPWLYWLRLRIWCRTVFWTAVGRGPRRP